MSPSKYPPRRPPGGKFNAATRGAIIGAIRSGSTYAVAARAAGVHPTTLTNWLRRGDYEDECGSDSEHARFAREFAQADANVIRQVEASVLRQAENDWRAGRFILSKRVPHIYGDKEGAHVIAQRTADWILDQVRTQCDEATFGNVLSAISGAVEVEGHELPADTPEEPPRTHEDAPSAAQGASEDASVIEPDRTAYVPAIMRGKEPIDATPRRGGNFDTSEGKFGLKEPGKKRRK